ncbi:hypothetical protein [Coraliomargarita parva]|uniref:hypothetical protein n=1 Tax=Coraliomargarita parva TaxID=3014050 RepID=UPI0022B416DA|nr:hypothetical protein [Coraliomargarita parva]
MRRYKKKPEDQEKFIKCYAESILRLQAEWYLVRDNCLPASLADHVLYKDFKRPTGWRLKIWKILLKTAFREIAEFSPEQNINTIGVLSGIRTTNNQMLESLESDDHEIWDKINKYLPEYDYESDLAQYEGLTEKLDLERMKELVIREEPQGLGELFKGYGTGLTMVGTIDKDGSAKATKPTTETDVYLFMLIFGDFIKELPSVEVVYDFMKQIMENDMPQGLDTFKRNCNRIGFVGASYKRTKRRINRQSIDT